MRDPESLRKKRNSMRWIWLTAVWMVVVVVMLVACATSKVIVRTDVVASYYSTAAFQQTVNAVIANVAKEANHVVCDVQYQVDKVAHSAMIVICEK